MLKVTISHFAEHDLQEIINYYDQINPDISDGLLQDVDDCLNRIEDLPEGYQKRHKEIHIAFLKHFSFGIFYKIYPNEISVVAILHTSQDMTKWLEGR